jgi:hypothetical protein
MAFSLPGLAKKLANPVPVSLQTAPLFFPGDREVLNGWEKVLSKG